jgi:steroid 5-alpha reductase family enzyme
MAVLWLVHLRLGNAAIVDVGWAAEVGALATVNSLTGAGWGPRRAVIAAIMATWALRLAVHLVRDRIAGRSEDARYVSLRRQWGAGATTRFFWFFQAQALAALFFSLPALVVSANPARGWHPLECLAVIIWTAAFAGESAADRQLARFKADPLNHGRTCRVGLWRYSRHPNYFFEWVMWVAYALFALPSPGGWIASACPLAMLYLLFRVTGIPATEAQALARRGDDYRDYQRTTSVFVPWFPTR